MNGNIRNRGYNILFSKKKSKCRTFSIYGLKDICIHTCTSLVAQWWRIHLPMEETRVQSLGWEDSLEKEMATHSSILAWEIHGQRSLAGYSLWGYKSQTQLSWRNNNNIHTRIQTCALTHARHFSKRIYLELASSEGEVLKVWGKVY